MSADATTCDLVDERDLDTRYLAGSLSPEEAEAFEAHYFGCERCWNLVHQGMEVRSALAHPAAPPGIRPRWWGLAAAAAVAALVVGTWWTASRSGSAPLEDVLRGDEAPFAVTAYGDKATTGAAWPRLPGADVYRVRLYTADGTLITERDVPDTSITLSRDSIRLPAETPALWEVQALDQLRSPVARSKLTRAALPSTAP